MGNQNLKDKNLPVVQTLLHSGLLPPFPPELSFQRLGNISYFPPRGQAHYQNVWSTKRQGLCDPNEELHGCMHET